MTRMEDILNKPYKDNGAYRVPEGYFADLNQRIMEQIPEAQSTTTKAKGLSVLMTSRLKYAAAACLIGIVGCSGLMFFNFQQNNQMTADAGQKTLVIDEYSQDCIDYAMLDKDDMYMFLAEQ